MLDVAISQLTTLRWDFSRELDRLAEHGFQSLAIWRPKLPDTGAAAAAEALAAAGMRASSFQGVGGFTGGDGRSFAESVADAVEAIETAAVLAGAARMGRPPVVVLQTGCRGGHIRAHALRLVHDALAAALIVARREGVALALEPVHAAAATDCSVLAGLDAALDVVDAHDDPALGVVLDLWHFGDDPGLAARLPRLASAAALVQVADRGGPPSPGGDRLPAGHGALPLEHIVTELVHHGYRGDFEFDPVGEVVESLGYDGVLGETRATADAWDARCALDTALAAATCGTASRAGHSRCAAAGAGSRRSQASSQTASRG